LPDDRSTSSSKDSKSISEETLIRRTASVLTAEIDKQIVMMDIESGRYLGLDDIGSVIWQRLETPRTFGDLVDSLVEDYDAERAVIAQDVRELLKEMATQGIVGFD
jgi:imidazolonepropionase-like amidohydrolase